MIVRDARTIWKHLNGVFCMYKPTGVSCNYVRSTVVNNICKDLCEMKCRPPSKYVSIEGSTNKELRVLIDENYADNTLVVGPRYQSTDVRCIWASFLGKKSSGVLLFGINHGTKLAQKICASRPVRTYCISGKFGEATDNHFKDGKVVEKSTYAFIKRGNIDKLLSAIEASHQKKMFELSGVDMQSQAAYELAVQGPIRPSNSKIPVLYGIKCTHYESPNFTIEVQCINEYEVYLRGLIHEIGMRMHSTAHCVSIQCIRYGHFDLSHALLRKHWSLQNVVNNMSVCLQVLAQQNFYRDQPAGLRY